MQNSSKAEDISPVIHPVSSVDKEEVYGFEWKVESLYAKIEIFLCGASLITFLPESPRGWLMSTCPWG